MATLLMITFLSTYLQLLISDFSLVFHASKQVKAQIHDAGYYVDADITDRKIDKKVKSSHVHVPVLFCGWLGFLTFLSDDCRCEKLSLRSTTTYLWLVKPKLLQDRLVIGFIQGLWSLAIFVSSEHLKTILSLLLFEHLQVSVRIRDSAAHSVKSIEDLLEEFKTKTAEYQ